LTLNATHTDARQVTGDLWERYMEMLTQDGMPEV
jgi:hypothetical protein